MVLGVNVDDLGEHRSAAATPHPATRVLRVRIGVFWLLTQLARVGEARKIEIRSAAVRVSPAFTLTGSMLAGTAGHQLRSMATELTIDCEGDDDTVHRLVDQAERMCFVLHALETTHKVRRATDD